MPWDSMSLDEFAEYHHATGMKVRKLAGTWWAEVRPFFSRPLFPFATLDPATARYPSHSRIGGVLHAVPPGVASNSRLNLFVYDDLKSYRLAVLGEKHRNITRKGIRNFTAKRITDPEEFVSEAYPVYRSFYERTGYWYKRDRLVRKHFAKWTEALFSNGKVVVLGAYRHGRLSAVDISQYVEDVIYEDTFFSDTESLSLKVTDFMLHTVRELAAASGAHYLFRGLPTGKRSLDESKLLRGCRVLELPAFCRLNPLALIAARLVMKESYNKLVGLTRSMSAQMQPGLASESVQ